MADPNVVLSNPVQSGTAREQELIVRVQRGEHELFYELVRPYERRVYAAALAILRNESDSEDVAQEAMLKALANIRQFRAEARFSTWLIQITVNEALMRRRRERKGMVEGIDDHRDDEGEYTPRDFADWREIPSETLERKEVTYSYFQDPMYVFMDHEYNQIEIEKENMGDALNYLEEGLIGEATFYDGKAISVELPTSVVREITTEPAVKGDTSGKVMKPAKIATGFEIAVPLFVESGDKIEIDTREHVYRKRV